MDHQSRRVRFEQFEVDCTTGELTRAGSRVTRLQEQPRLVLDALLSPPGRLVSREELHGLLWPRDALVDAENGLNIAINKIRIALGDSATKPRFIETIPRRGYRFIAAVLPINEQPLSDGPADHSTAPLVTPIPTLVQSSEPPAPSPVKSIALLALVAITALGVLVMRKAPNDDASRVRSVAILPFTNLLGDADREYVVRGLAESLATELAARGLPRVISPAAGAYYAARQTTVDQVARELGVDALIVGSVVRDAASFAVNVQLVSGRDQSPLWASRFARATAIELSASDDIATALARELGLAPPHATSTAPLIPFAARDAYLRGRFYWNQRTSAGLRAAVDHLTRAIQDAPDFALAWAGLADVYASGGTVVSAAIAPWPGDPNTAGIRAAERALQLDPRLGEAHAARGKLLMELWRWADAERELAVAVRVSPNYATARQWYGTLLARLKKCDAAVEQVRIGSEIDPVTPIINEAVGSTFSMCGQPDRAAAAHRRVLEMHPVFATAHMLLGSALYRLGNLTEAEASLREALSLRPENCQIRARLAATLFEQHRADAHALAAGVIHDAHEGRASFYCTALAEAGGGRGAAALDLLDLAYARREGELDLLLVDPILSPLRAEPRFLSLLERVGLSPYAATPTSASDSVDRH